MARQHSRRDFLRRAALGAALVSLGSRMPRGHAAPAQRPNIIWMMADDLGYGDVGCYGATKIRTPHMDALAKEGVRLTDAHTPSSVCTPTRYGTVTGRYAWRTRLKQGVIWSGYEPLLIDEGRPTVATLLRDQGYRTGAVGKWHLGFTREEPADYGQRLEPGPEACGFDYSYLVPASHDMAPYCYIENGNVVGDFIGDKEVLYPQQRKGPVTDNWDDFQIGPRLVEQAVGFIARAAETPDKPFFLYYTPVAPHRPNEVAPFMQGKSDAGERGDHAQEFDWAVGEVVKALEEQGLAENTLLIVTSDNGARPAGVDGDTHGHKSCGDLRGFKGMIYEGGHRVPLIARWPGHITPGTTSDAMVVHADLFATCAGILGAALTDDAAEDSFDMLPALTEGKQVRRDAVFHDVKGNFAMREGDWKLVLLDPEKPELYNLAEDLAEEHDVAADHADKAGHLKERLAEYQASGRSR